MHFLTLGGRVKQVQPFKGFPPFDLGGEFIHGSNTVVNKIAHDNGWLVLPVSQFLLLIIDIYYNLLLCDMRWPNC